jgi:tape measure domain-containing protein
VNAIGGIETAALAASAAAGKAGGSLGNLSDVAGRTSASIEGGLTASFARFDKQTEKLTGGLTKLGEGLQGIGGSLTTFVTAPLALLGGAALKSAGDIQALEKGFAATYEGSEQLGEALAKVQELAKLPGLGLEEALQGATNLQAAGFSAGLARRALGAFGNALATVGKGKADLDGVGLALGQIASKGKISAEEINQLAERVPQIRKAMQAAFGTADTEVLQKLGIGATEFVEGVTRELEKLPKVTGGINNAFENLADAGTISLSKLGGALNRAFDVEGVLGKLADLVTGAATAFGQLEPSTQKAIFGLAGAAAALGPLVFGIGTVVIAIAKFKEALLLLELSSGAVFAPLLIGVATVALVVYEVIQHWDDLVSYFSQSGEGGHIFSDLADSVQNAVGQISNAFSALNKSGDFGDLVSATGILKAAFRDIAVGVTAVANVLGGTVGAIVALFNRDLTGAAEQASQAFLGLAQPIANVLGFQLRLADSGGAVQKGFEGAAFGGGVFGDELLHLSGLLPGFNSQLQGFAGGLPQYEKAAEQYGGILEKLRARLEKLQAQREKETTIGAIRLDTSAIDAVQKQIDALVGKAEAGSDAIAKAFEALQKSVRAAEGQSIALGNAFDYIGARRSALESGIKGLIAAGLSPTSAAIKALVKDLNSLPEAIDQIARRAATGTQSVIPEFKLELPELQALPELLEPDYAGTFGRAAQAVLVGGGQVSDAFESANITLSEKQANALDRQRAFNTQFEELIDQLSVNIGPLLADFAVGFGDALGSIATGASGAADAFTTLFGGILQSIGSFMSQFGSQLIAIGIGKQVLDGLFTSIGTGPLAIAAGIGLVALGGVVAAVGKSAAASVKNIGSGGASLASQPSPATASTNTANQQPLRIIAEFRIAGRDLRAVGALEEYRVRRT